MASASGPRPGPRAQHCQAPPAKNNQAVADFWAVGVADDSGICTAGTSCARDTDEPAAAAAAAGARITAGRVTDSQRQWVVLIVAQKQTPGLSDPNPPPCPSVHDGADLAAPVDQPVPIGLAGPAGVGLASPSLRV